MLLCIGFEVVLSWFQLLRIIERLIVFFYIRIMNLVLNSGCRFSFLYRLLRLAVSSIKMPIYSYIVGMEKLENALLN